MCRVLKVLVVAPAELHAELRRRLAALEYDLVAAVEPPGAGAVAADVALVWQPTPEDVARLRGLGLKVVAVGGDAGADLALDPDRVEDFKQRVWELFRAPP